MSATEYLRPFNQPHPILRSFKFLYIQTPKTLTKGFIDCYSDVGCIHFISI